MKLSGWGNYPILPTELCQAAGAGTLASLVKAEGAALARGAGRAYGDAAIGLQRTIALTPMDRFIKFDPQDGLLTVEAGATLADIIRIFLPRGFFPPVVPGTQFVTVGGMIAANIHGKNHHHDGGFGRHLVEIELIGPDGNRVVCSETNNQALFRATIGGMGLTGIIATASFRMNRVETPFIRQETLAAANLDEAMRLCEESRDWHYVVAWIDGLGRGSELGRSLIYRGEHARRDEVDGAAIPARPQREGHPALSVPFFLPPGALNRASVRAFNEIYYRRGAAKPKSVVHWAPYFFPLDTIGDWNRIYGRRGFFQHQCVIPKAKSRDGIGELLERISRRGSPSFLAVLKLLGPDEAGLLSFPMEGYTLAVDFPADSDSLALSEELDAVVAAYGGRLYLAKDARQSRDTFEQGYPRLGAFRDLRRSGGAALKFRSYQSERLGL